MSKLSDKVLDFEYYLSSRIRSYNPEIMPYRIFAGYAVWNHLRRKLYETFYQHAYELDDRKYFLWGFPQEMPLFVQGFNTVYSLDTSGEERKYLHNIKHLDKMTKRSQDLLLRYLDIFYAQANTMENRNVGVKFLFVQRLMAILLLDYIKSPLDMEELDNLFKELSNSKITPLYKNCKDNVILYLNVLDEFRYKPLFLDKIIEVLYTLSSKYDKYEERYRSRL